MYSRFQEPRNGDSCRGWRWRLDSMRDANKLPSHEPFKQVQQHTVVKRVY